MDGLNWIVRKLILYKLYEIQTCTQVFPEIMAKKLIFVDLDITLPVPSFKIKTNSAVRGSLLSGFRTIQLRTVHGFII